jgi:6-pyruvoyltetrahydropterin/6-carboxytetrahydropterin synthase
VFHVTRRYEFPASHRLHSSQLSDDENSRLYGKCNNPYGHGHNYIVEVSVRGPLDPVSGRAVDSRLLDELVKREVLERFGHTDLNADVNFATVVPTSENLAAQICSLLKRNWSTVFPGEWPRLEKIRIAETPRNIFAIRADEIE